jgi:hypothetical protein
MGEGNYAIAEHGRRVLKNRMYPFIRVQYTAVSIMQV